MLTGMPELCGIACYFYVTLRSVSAYFRFPRTFQSRAECFWNWAGGQALSCMVTRTEVTAPCHSCSPTALFCAFSVVWEVPEVFWWGSERMQWKCLRWGQTVRMLLKVLVNCKGGPEYRAQIVWRKHAQNRVEKHGTHCNCCSLLLDILPVSGEELAQYNGLVYLRRNDARGNKLSRTSSWSYFTLFSVVKLYGRKSHWPSGNCLLALSLNIYYSRLLPAHESSGWF